MATIIQRVVNNSSGEDALGITEAEKEELLAEMEKIQIYMDGSIVGKIITVQYFEETKNDKGGISLRFPTVKIVHGDKREV